MCRRRILATGLVLTAALWAAPAALALPANLPAYFFGSKLARAEILVKDGGVAHDYRVDRGRIRRLSADSVALLERDGSLQTITVAPGTLVGLRRGMVVTVVRDGNAPANSVLTGSAVPLGIVMLGPKFVRGEIVARNSVVHDYRIDRGRIRTISSDSLALLEKDGTLQTVPLAAGVRVTINGAARPFVRLRTGMTATTIRDGSAPAFEVRATR